MKRNAEDCKKRELGYKFGPESGTQYRCVSRQTAHRLIVRKEAKNASNLCPPDSRQEPIIRDRLVTNNGLLSYPQASLISSNWIDSNLVEFPKQPTRSWAVDRSTFSSYFLFCM